MDYRFKSLKHMEGKDNDSFSMHELANAVSMASIADERYPSEVFTDFQKFSDGGEYSALMESDHSIAGTESANSFQYENPSLIEKRLSTVGLKTNDPMWNSSEPTAHPSAGKESHIDRAFVEDLLTLVDTVDANSSQAESTSLPIHTDKDRRRPSRAKSFSRMSSEHFHIFPWGRSHSPTPSDNSSSGGGSMKMDCSVDGQKMSSSSSDKGGHHRHFRWPHRTKHHSVEDKKSSDHGSHGSHGHGSSHHFQELVHYFRRFSHLGHDSHKDHNTHDDKEMEPPRKQRVQRTSSGHGHDDVSVKVAAAAPMIRDRSHSMGAKPKKRNENTIQAVYTIYDSIVKEGKMPHVR